MDKRCSIARVFLLLFLLSGATRSLAQSPASAGEETAEAARFDILEYQVEGNTVLAVRAVERSVYSHLGKGRTIKDVEAARSALEQAYHQSGYLTVFVDIPEQTVASGIVRLRVTEGRIERTRVTGSRYYALGEIRRRAPSLAEGSVPHFPAVQQELAQLNKSQDRRVTPVLKPGRTPGRVEVDLKVEDKLPLHGSVELNDRYSGDTTLTRLAASLRYDNLWQREHSLALQAQVSPQQVDETLVLAGTYVLPVGAGDKLLALYALRSESDTAAVGALNVIGKGTIYGARAIVPLRSIADYFHSVTLGMDHKRFHEAVVLQGADSVNTPISYTPMSVQYAGTLLGKHELVQFDAAFNFALRGVLGNDEVEFADKRFKASAGYSYVRSGVAWTRALPQAGITLYSRVEGQLAGGPLISNEQFAIGGVESVRGYREAESLGDNGARASLELRVPFGGAAGATADRYVALFLDGGTVRIQDPLPAQQQRYTLAGTGLGLRFKHPGGLALALDLARALRSGSYTDEGDIRLHFRLAFEF